MNLTNCIRWGCATHLVLVIKNLSWHELRCNNRYIHNDICCPKMITDRLLVLNVYTYIRNMRSGQASLLEISSLEGIHNLTPVDPQWPLTSSKNNRLLVLNVVHLHTKYEICPSLLLDISCLQAGRHHTHTPVWLQRFRLSAKPKSQVQFRPVTRLGFKGVGVVSGEPHENDVEHLCCDEWLSKRVLVFPSPLDNFWIIKCP